MTPKEIIEISDCDLMLKVIIKICSPLRNDKEPLTSEELLTEVLTPDHLDRVPNVDRIRLDNMLDYLSGRGLLTKIGENKYDEKAVLTKTTLSWKLSFPIMSVQQQIQLCGLD